MQAIACLAKPHGLILGQDPASYEELWSGVEIRRGEGGVFATFARPNLGKVSFSTYAAPTQPANAMVNLDVVAHAVTCGLKTVAPRTMKGKIVQPFNSVFGTSARVS